MDYVDIDDLAIKLGLDTESGEEGVLIKHPELGLLGRCWYIGRGWMWQPSDETNAARIRSLGWLEAAWKKEINRRTREGAGVVA